MSLAAAGLLVLLIIGFVGLLAFGRDLLGAQIVPDVSYTSWSISAIALATVAGGDDRAGHGRVGNADAGSLDHRVAKGGVAAAPAIARRPHHQAALASSACRVCRLAPRHGPHISIRRLIDDVFGSSFMDCLDGLPRL